MSSPVEDVLFKITLSGLIPHTNVELQIDTYPMYQLQTDYKGECVFTSFHGKYFRPVRYDGLALKFFDAHPGLCTVDLDKRPMPEEDRHLLISAHKALVIKLATNIASNRPLYTCDCSDTDVPLTDEHLKVAYNTLNLDKTYGAYDSFISKQFTVA